MSKEIYISSTPHETRLAIVENEALAEIYYERENEYTLAGSIYNGKVTRVLPGMQSSFVDIGLERDAFLYITDFMEEAGDSADFETNGDHGRPPRSPERGEGRRDGRGDRNGNPPTLEGAIASPPDRLDQTTDSGTRSPERTDRSGRGDRGRRGRRDRSGNRDRQPGSDAVAPLDPPDAIRAELNRENFDRPDSFAPTQSDTPGENSEGSDLGEGAPGADGSRRWRGRRGRRRGRGPGQRDESPQAAGAPSQPGHASDEAPNEIDYNDSFEIDGAAAAGPVANNSAPIPSAYPPPDAAQEPSGRRDRGDRGDRNDRSGRGDRGGRDRGRDDRGSRVPRGFTPKVSLYGVDSTPAYDSTEVDGTTPEPIVLPGESLSKYRKGGEEPAAPKPVDADIIIPAAADFAIPSGWDGGATLPGETLSRHRRSDSRTEHRQDSRADNRRSAEPPQPRAQAAQETRGVSAPQTVGQTVPKTVHERPEAQLQHQASAPAMPVEYEPTEASASYRVDLAAPSEYRQSAPILDEPTEVSTQEAPAEAPVDEASANEQHVAPHKAQPEDSLQEQKQAHEQSSVHSITPGPGESFVPLHTEPAPVHENISPAHEKFDWQTDSTGSTSTHGAEAAPAPHELTTLHATGEMHSEAPVAAFTPEPAAEAISPILHETAIANPAENTVEGGAVLPHFAPGAGVLEEEVIDEEDYNTTLHASSIEEMDDFEEEETLEGAADLGTMIREMSIDQITRSGNVDEEEEDDLEEEDTLHDPIHDELDETDEEDEDDEDLEESDPEEDVLHEDLSENGDVTRPNGADHAQNGAASPSSDRNRDQDRGRGRRDGRRDGRRGDRFGRSSGDRSERPRNTGGAGDRERSGGGGGGRDRRGGRSSMQSTNLPAISELLKPGQEILVQIAKEPIAKKGARITSHIALPGRFLVFMPTVNHTGVSRKIESDGERRRLKEILLSEKGEAAGGFIVRTAASGASEEELRSDLRFLLNLWADIKQRSESSKSPALIYHDLNLVERILRDQVTDNFSAIWVDTETEYERVLRFLQRFQPSLIRRVKLYTKETPLFEQFGITEEINKALRSKVWLKSGGSIVINQTEALVAIDINTGKFVGKTARLEDTIVKTNLDAIPEIVRQIRLRDLGGIIIIDFIDMDERKNRNKVMAALEEELKSDRAPSKVLQFNDFGLVAITRKRVKQSLERTLSTTCNVCVGTGMVKSPITVCNDIYVEMRKMHKHLDRGDVMLRVHPEVVKQLKTTGGRWLQEMEEMVGKTILVKSDPSLHPEQFDIH
jgi:ribonuclease E